jgi:hypothetical protein
MEDKLELRMYGLINYQLSGTIHAGIQYGHAVVEYGLKFFDTPEYQDWANNHKTFIILNGGTTNNNQLCYGTLNQYKETLINNGITIADFHEPDLGDQLTAVVFIVDEKVFDLKKYPDFSIYVTRFDEYPIVDYPRGEFELRMVYPDRYNQWLEFIGGGKNLFLREFLKGKKLA